MILPSKPITHLMYPWGVVWCVQAAKVVPKKPRKRKGK